MSIKIITPRKPIKILALLSLGMNPVRDFLNKDWLVESLMYLIFCATLTLVLSFSQKSCFWISLSPSTGSLGFAPKGKAVVSSNLTPLVPHSLTRRGERDEVSKMPILFNL
jgi:hypothetical protein